MTLFLSQGYAKSEGTSDRGGGHPFETKMKSILINVVDEIINFHDESRLILNPLFKNKYKLNKGKFIDLNAQILRAHLESKVQMICATSDEVRFLEGKNKLAYYNGTDPSNNLEVIIFECESELLKNILKEKEEVTLNKIDVNIKSFFFHELLRTINNKEFSENNYTYSVSLYIPALKKENTLRRQDLLKKREFILKLINTNKKFEVSNCYIEFFGYEINIMRQDETDPHKAILWDKAYLKASDSSYMNTEILYLEGASSPNLLNEVFNLSQEAKCRLKNQN